MKVVNGSVRVFQLFGIEVFVHWSWVILALPLVLWQRSGGPPWLQHSLAFDVAVYLGLFAIVLLHEFGHALACRSVGGEAQQIVLWPLGGLAYVSPPPRPGALLWSIAAGPLVNVVLFLLSLPVIMAWLGLWPWMGVLPKTTRDFAVTMTAINFTLLVFNVLPIYPMDGGNILYALLWFVVGRAAALMAACVVGLLGAGLLLLLALLRQDWFLMVMTAWLAMTAWRGFQSGRRLWQVETGPRHREALCPACGEARPVGLLWRCPCGQILDTFACGGRCPRCGRAFEVTACPRCGKASAFADWYRGRAAAPAVTVPPVLKY